MFSTGPDLLSYVTKLVNVALAEGCVPLIVSKKIVTSVITKSSLPSENIKNYCPVPGLSFMSKLVE